MQIRLCRVVVCSTLAGLAAVAAPAAKAQDWSPQRNVEVVVPVPAGGALDLLARSMQQVWTEQGYKGTWESWRGLIGTKGMTPAQVAYWEQVSRRVTENEQFRKFVEASDLEIRFMGSAEVRKWLAAQYDDMKAVMATLGYAKQ